MVTIEEVQDVLSRTILPPPKHLYISEKPIQVHRPGEKFWIMGFQRRGSDMIVVTPYSTTENIIHELLHSLGFGEFVAQVGGILGALRIKLFPNIFRRNVRYRLVEEDVAEKLGLKHEEEYYVLEEHGGKKSFQVKHFILEMV